MIVARHTFILTPPLTHSVTAQYTKGGPLPGNAYASEKMPGSSSEYSNWSGQVRSAEETRRAQNAELNNGRLAMIAIMSFSAAAMVPGSVPFLPSPF